MLKSIGILLIFLHCMVFCCFAKTSQNIPIRFPGEKYHNATIDQESVEFAARANSLASIDDFLKYFEVEPPAIKVAVSNRFGGSTTIESKVIRLSAAVCKASDTLVHLDLPSTDDKAITYFPTCVNVPRCGGCCLLPNFSCQPSKKENIPVQVTKLNAIVDNNLRRRRRTRKSVKAESQTVKVERHIECECACKLQEKDCSPAIHEYNGLSCECVCLNKDEENLCYESREHFWDHKTCSCGCRPEISTGCTSGTNFDKETCSCI